MGEVIQLFRDPTPADSEPFDPESVSPEVIESMTETMHDLDHILDCDWVEEFRATMASIKERVASWPDG